MPWEKKWFQFAVLLLLAFIWGSSFILMKIGLKSFTSVQTASLRIGFASLFLLPLSVKYLKQLKRKDLLPLFIAGFLGNFLPAFLFTKAQTRIDSALAGMLNSLTPVFTMLVGLLFFKLKVKGRQFIGISLGLLGALGLITSGKDVALSNINSYAFFIVLATICYAFNINVVKSFLGHLSGVKITALSFLFIGPPAIINFFMSDWQSVGMSFDWQWHLAALAVLGIMGTAIAMLMMNTLIGYASPVFASSVTYVIPIFAISWGVFDGEIITAFHLLFMGVVLIGVYLINRKKKGCR
ncbi:DMT family transporter [Carboxylicivirga sp. A043]|uniref:DMT family transporter n=1 Tax=Carboxylicivirga litoralis TaxID=2816963 RepID=UPI0021CB3A99|nr:DMT family transporter [Carboxylicivirga sp. A043]MCU4154480.1 DMT family transporter [Carboxylicivirga sp. A043]